LRRNLKKQAVAQAKATAGVRFVAVKVNGAPPLVKDQSCPALEVLLAGERRIGVAPGFDSVTLSRLVQLLEDL
jgi:hypothetical protein